ncbi:hypothetical protein ACFL6I_16300 [candidate division KSB1 bacterium]
MRLRGEYFFCTPTGKRIHRSNLYMRVWIPTLKKADLELRSVKQTRQSFAILALTSGENPLWIARVIIRRH